MNNNHEQLAAVKKNKPFLYVLRIHNRIPCVHVVNTVTVDIHRAMYVTCI